MADLYAEILHARRGAGRFKGRGGTAQDRGRNSSSDPARLMTSMAGRLKEGRHTAYFRWRRQDLGARLRRASDCQAALCNESIATDGECAAT